MKTTIEIDNDPNGVTSYISFDGERDLSSARIFTNRGEAVKFFEDLAAQRHMHLTWEVFGPMVIGKYVG